MTGARTLAAALAPLLLAGCFAGTPPTNEEAPIAPLTDSELRVLTTEEKAVLAKGFAAGLKDPTSAIFQWTKVPKRLPENSFDYCALVNAKNSYGGYTGATPFMGMVLVRNGKIVSGVTAVVGDIDRRYSHILPEMCRKKGLDPYAISEG